MTEAEAERQNGQVILYLHRNFPDREFMGVLLEDAHVMIVFSCN